MNLEQVLLVERHDADWSRASLLFMGNECAGLHDLTVIEEPRGLGFGAALLATSEERRAAGVRTL